MTKTNFTLSLSTTVANKSRNARLSRHLLTASAAALALCASLFVAAHKVPGFGPGAADALREVIGVDGVARLEDTAYAMKDALHQVTRKGDAPKSYWEVPPSAPQVTANVAPLAALPQQSVAPIDVTWSPAPASVPFTSVAAQGDAVWVPLSDVGDGSEMKKTLLHPDKARTWAELFVVAIDLNRVSLHWVPGTAEPLNTADGAEALKRPARIPSETYTALLAAFNGGFKTQHGKFGAKSDGITLVPPRPQQCTLGQAASGKLVLGTYEHLDERENLAWFRQTPGCMVESGKIHPQLASDASTNWGATLDGNTVIRRSAIGLSRDERTLYVGISNDTTARALALGMQAAGADTVAQLDVNYAYPKFVLYDDRNNAPAPRSLTDGFVLHDAQYLKAESRDFFYLTKK